MCAAELDHKELLELGENRSRPVYVRVVTATNRDLAQAVASGAFRQDPYYRLKVVGLHVPPLRERRDGASTRPRGSGPCRIRPGSSRQSAAACVLWPMGV